VEFTVAGTPDDAGVIVEYGQLKSALRGWIDHHLDHGAMLGAEDPLVPALIGETSKVFVFYGWDPQDITHGLPWPTVENVAELLRRVAVDLLDPAVTVERVKVTETHTNAAEVEV
jgi:6-pyruvoyltetrahydropterin/6-carboxytetrahydropterin synthase